MLIPRDILEVHRITSKDEERPNLLRVHAERDAKAPRLTATDGHRLITVTWTEPEVTDPPADFGDLTNIPGFIADVPAEACAEIARIVPKGEVGEIYRHAWLEETTTDGLVRMGAGDKVFGQAIQSETKAPEIEFPAYETVLKSVGTSVKIGVNAKLLADLLTTMGKVSGEPGVVLHIPNDPQAPIGLHVDSLDGQVHVDAVLMPMLLDLTGRPDWEDVPILPNVHPGKKPPDPEPAQDTLVK